LFENSPFDERTRQIISKCKMPLGVLIDKDLQQVKRVFMPLFSAEDIFLTDYAQRLIHNSDASISVLDINNLVKTHFVMESALHSLEEKYPSHMILLEERIMKKEFLTQQDLMIISLDSWKKLVDSQSVWLSNVPSVLIIKA